MADMLAGRLHVADRGLQMERVPVPEPGHGEVPHDTLFSYLRQSVRGHDGSEREHVPQLVALVRHGRLRLDASVSDVLPLAEAPLAVERLQSKQGSPVRLVLTPSGG